MIYETGSPLGEGNCNSDAQQYEFSETVNEDNLLGITRPMALELEQILAHHNAI